MAPPALNDDLCFAQGVEDLAVEQLTAQAGVEAFDEPVLPGAARGDVGGLGADAANPFLHRPGNALDATLISSEFFSSRFGESEIASLAHDFEDYDCHVVAVVRPHIERLRSAYSSLVSAGSRWTFEEFVRQTIVATPDDKGPHSIFCDVHYRYPRYKTTLSLWEKYFNKQISIIDYSITDHIASRIIRTIIPELDLSALPMGRHNVSLPWQILEKMRAINYDFLTYEELVSLGETKSWNEISEKRQREFEYLQSTTPLNVDEIEPSSVFFLGGKKFEAILTISSQRTSLGSSGIMTFARVRITAPS